MDEELNGDNLPTLADDVNRTELANAQRFIAHHGQNVRYVPPWGVWLVWDGLRWKKDDCGTVQTLFRSVIEEVWAGVDGEALRKARDAQAILGFARNTASEHGMRAALKLAQSEPGVAISPNDLDQHPFLLNVQNGTLDLQTGELKPHDRGDLLTQLAPVTYAPRHRSERWELFVSQIMGHDQELVGFLKRLCGYFLTGSVAEQIMPIFHGCGANGKSKLIETLQAVLGPDYSMAAPPDLLLVKRHASHPTERADLFGKRLVFTIETGSGQKFDESLVKTLTGGDRIRARRLHENYWEFSPTHKLVMGTNHPPIVRGQDHGIWRRLAMVPFEIKYWDPDKGETGPPELEADKGLGDRLKRERDLVLTWLVEGCLEWQRSGLKAPDKVRTATDEYRAANDVIGQFFDDACVVEERAIVAAGMLYKAYVEWSRDNGHQPDTAQAFGRKLGERGIGQRRGAGGVKLRVGVGLLVGREDHPGVRGRLLVTDHTKSVT